MLNLTDENFEKEIQGAEKPVLVDFWASWCNPCHVLSPILEKLGEEFKGKIIFAKANVDEAPKISQKFSIDKIPTVILFKEGKPQNGFSGLRSESIIREWLEDNLKNDEKAKIEKLTREVEEDKSSSPPSLSLRESSVYEEYAKTNGFKLNPNREVVARIVKGLLEREKKFGKRYCVCRRITGNSEEDEKIACPCIYAPKEIEERGHCFCNLFFKKDNNGK